MSEFGRGACEAAFGADRVHEHAPLGAVDDVSCRRTGRLCCSKRGRATRSSRRWRWRDGHGVPVTMLGGGSNVLISDAGVRGLVIRPRGGAISRPLTNDHVRADAAVTINGLVRWTILHGCGGLEAWAGTPGTVGGAIFGNAHFGGRLIGELVSEVRLVDRARTDRRTCAPKRWPSATIAAACRRAAKCCCRRLSRCIRRVSRRAAGHGAGIAGVSQADAAARVAERRLRLPESGARSRHACRTASRGRPARSSIAPGSRAWRSAARACRRRTATSSSTTAARRPPTSGRSSSAAATRCATVRRRSARGDRASRRLLGGDDRVALTASDSFHRLNDPCPHCSSKADGVSPARSPSKATRTPRCRCWPRAC